MTNKYERSLWTTILGGLLLITFFLIPYYKMVVGDYSLTMWKMVTDSSVSQLMKGSFWLYLILLTPIYMILDANKDKIPAIKVAFPLPSSVTASLPFVSFLIYGFYLYVDPWLNVSFGYYIYLVGSALAAAINIPEAKTEQDYVMQKAIGIAGGALILIFVVKDMMVLNGRDPLTFFSEIGRAYRNEDLQIALKWIAMALMFIAFMTIIAAFRETKALDNIRKALPSPKVLAIILTIVCGLVSLCLFVIAANSHDDFQMGPAAPTCLVLSVFLLVLAQKKSSDMISGFANTGESKEAAAYESGHTAEQPKNVNYVVTNLPADELTEKKRFFQLQFSMLLIVCSLLPDFGNMISEALGFGGLSIAVIIARVLGIVFGGWALYYFYQAKGGKLPIPFLCSVGGGLLLTLITLIPGTPTWLDYIALVVLLFGLWVSKTSLRIEWRTLSSQGAYLILLACLLNCYHAVDPKISTSIASLVGLIMYLVGLGKLKKSLDAEGIMGASRLKIAAWLGIVAAVIGLIPLLGTIIAGIIGIVAFIFEFLGYTSLMKSEPLHQLGRDGAKTLRMSMIIMVIATLIGIFPLTGLIVGLITLVALWFIYEGWTNVFFGLEQQTVAAPVAGQQNVAERNVMAEEQTTVATPTADDQMKAMKEKGEAALASAKESMANLQQDMAPKLEKAKSWAAANKKVLGIGAGAVVVVALLAWLIPKIGTSKGIAFETYTVEDNIQAYVDIPVGDSEKAQNARKGLCEVIGMTHMADELGAPLESTSPREVIDDYNKRFSGYLDKFCRETGAPIAPSCQIFIESGFQNEACVVFEAAGSIYFNGSPDTYLRVVRLADGHVMKQEEMVTITVDDLGPLVEKYEQEGLSGYLGDGFYFTPAANDSCMAIWHVGHGYGTAMIPLSDMEPYMTEAGRELFTAKAVEVPEKKQQAMEADENQEAEAENAEDSGDALDMEVDDFVGGLLGALPNGATKYVGDMAGFPIELTIHKDDGGLRADYLNVKYSAKMKLVGESLPADGGNITFFGQDAQGNQWFFDLEGDADNITGTGRGGGKNLPITLHRKN